MIQLNIQYNTILASLMVEIQKKKKKIVQKSNKVCRNIDTNEYNR